MDPFEATLNELRNYLKSLMISSEPVTKFEYGGDTPGFELITHFKALLLGEDSDSAEVIFKIQKFFSAPDVSVKSNPSGEFMIDLRWSTQPPNMDALLNFGVVNDGPFAGNLYFSMSRG